MMENHGKTLKIDEKPIYSFSAESAKIHLSLGNSKMGKIINWSTLPGNTLHPLIAKGRRVTDISGTCSHNCQNCFKSCYARRSILQHHNQVAQAWAENTLMIKHRAADCFAQIDAELNTLNKKYLKTQNPADLRFTHFRVNTSGELQSVAELVAWNELAKKHPELKFGIYSKNSEVLLSFFAQHKQTAPNFCINISEWHGCMKDTIAALHAMGAQFNVFEYTDVNLASAKTSPEEQARVAALPKCPAVGPTAANRHPVNPATGETWHCDECQACYRKTGTHRCVYSH